MPQVGAPPGTPETVEIFDTTLRDGAQFEGISLTVDDKLRDRRAARPPRRALHRGRLSRRQPEGRRVLPAGGQRAAISTRATLVAFGSTRAPRARSTTTRRCGSWSRPALQPPASSGKSWDYHVTEALRTTLDEGVAMVGDSVAFLKAAGLRVFFDAEHFFDGYKRNPEFACGCSRPPPWPAPTAWCCATPTVARCPTRCERIVGETVVVLRRRRRSASTPERHRLRAWPTPWPACVGRRHPGAGHHQRLRRAHRQLQPDHRHPRPRR